MLQNRAEQNLRKAVVTHVEFEGKLYCNCRLSFYSFFKRYIFQHHRSVIKTAMEQDVSMIQA